MTGYGNPGTLTVSYPGYNIQILNKMHHNKKLGINIRYVVILLFILSLTIFGSRVAISAGPHLSFSSVLPWETVVKDHTLKAAKYLFVVDDWDECTIAVYSPGVKIVQTFIGRQKVKSKPLATFDGGCFFAPDLVSKPKVQLVGDTNDAIAVLLFETPDYRYNKTRTIMLLLKKANQKSRED